MDQRVAFIADWLHEEWTMTELAHRYAISRKTAYKWVARYQADPAHGLAEHSRAPHAHGRAMSADVRAAVLALRRAHPRRGPKKLRALLRERAPELAERYAAPRLHPPFNLDARRRAGFTAAELKALEGSD